MPIEVITPITKAVMRAAIKKVVDLTVKNGVLMS